VAPSHAAAPCSSPRCPWTPWSALHPPCGAATPQVRVGSMSDPDELPGLAHFCEHMLFYSSDKYPVEDEYSKYALFGLTSSSHVLHVWCYCCCS
jgi:Insulinase (Peptidase family M16)